MWLREVRPTWLRNELSLLSWDIVMSTDLLHPPSRTPRRTHDQVWSQLSRVTPLYHGAERLIQRQWIELVKVTHMRELFAEFLGTFLLTVSLNVYRSQEPFV